MVHETLYHFHKPKDKAEANLWMRRALVTYNNGDHRSEPHSRIEDWLRYLPPNGVRVMCSWERFCAFAREPERRAVAGDATVSVEGASYEVEPELAGETVTLWWGLFDQELYVEFEGRRFGPYQPSRGAIPLYRYRKYQKSRAEERLNKVMKLADQLGLPHAAVTGGDRALPSLAVDKRRTSLPSLIEAMFYDLTPGDRSKVKIPKQPERRERELRDLMRKNKHPVLLIVDEAHELHHKTLTGFKRLMELAAGAGVVLSVLLIGNPKLRNDLRRPQMEEIGYRTTTFEFEGVSGHRREFIAWLPKACIDDGISPADIMDADAIDLLAERLRTALQIEMHLTLAFEHAFRLGEKRVSAEVVEQVLSRAIDELEPTLTRNGYDAPALTVLLRAKPAEVRDFLAGTLALDRARECTEQLRVASVPV